MSSKTIVVDGGWGLERLRVERREIATPERDEVLVRLRAASLNFRDLLMVQGKYNPRQPLPLVPGSDGAGVVEACGPDVTSFAPGDRVMPAFFRDWIAGPPTRRTLRTSLGGPLDGTLRQHICAPQHAFVTTPGHLSDAEASTLPCAALTAWSALVEQGGLKAGESVLVLGTGGVSMFAIQFAKLFGARVIATSSSNAKLDLLRTEYEVDELINYRDDPEWGRAVRDLSGGGVDHVVEVGGAGTLERSIQAVKPGGTISLIGVLAGAKSDLDLTSVLMQNIRIQGVIVGPRCHLESMNRAIAVNELRPRIDRTLPLDEVAAAFEGMQSQAHIGKVVIDLGEDA